MTRYYVIIPTNDVTMAQFHYAIQNDFGKLKTNVDGSKVILKFDEVDGVIPIGFQGLTHYTKDQILTEFTASEWQTT